MFVINDTKTELDVCVLCIIIIKKLNNWLEKLSKMLINFAITFENSNGFKAGRG